MQKLCNINCNLNEISTNALAFIGDAVFDLLVREMLVCTVNSKVKELNLLKISTVCCKSQAKIAKNLLCKLTEEELKIYKRGKNLKVNSIPKSAREIDYHMATGLEALFGFIYLKDDINRLREIFLLCINKD